MGRTIAFGAVLLAIVSAVSAAPRIDLVVDGKAQAVIVVGPDAIAPERTAARELAAYLAKSTGADFAITDRMPTRGRMIVIGQTAAAKRVLDGFDWSKLGRDGIVMKTVGGDLVLAGDRPRGSIYAVESFLEDQLGVRWWASDAERVPQHRDLSIGSVDVVYTPPFMYREAFFQPMNTDNSDLPMHLKLNGHHQRIPADKGGHYSILGWCHTFYQLLPAEKYFKDHPEWYSEVNGKRTPEWAQMCLTNPEMKDEMVKQALAWIDRNPEAGIISIAQNDCGNPCQCPKCRALVERTGGESGALITFVNSVAEEIEKRYPDFLVETLAYQYTRKAPTGVKPRHNVIVRLCSIECNFGQPLESKANETFMRDLTAWKQISQRLYVWDYVVNFANLLIPHPNFDNLAPNVRTFARNNVVGLFEQGDAYNPSAVMNPLKAYMLAKLMWDPRCDDKALIREFTDGYYGPAGPHMRRYLQALTDAVKREKPNLSCFTASPRYYSFGDLSRANEAMSLAVDAVKSDPVLLRRVQVQKLALDHLLIITRRRFGVDGQAVKGVEWDRIVPELLGLSDATSNVYINEGTAMSDAYRKSLAAQGSTPARSRKADPPAPGKRGVDWVDFQENAFSLANEGMWVTVVPDEAASDGLSCRMPGDSTQWAVQHSISPGEIIAPEVDVVARIRVDASGTSGMAVNLGVYDADTPAHFHKEFPVSEVADGGYHEYRLRDIALKPGMYIYVAPCGNPSVSSISVDRIFLVKPSGR